MFKILKHLLNLHRELFKKMLLIDCVLALLSQFFIFGAIGYFDYLGNSVYFAIFFLSILSYYISLYNIYSAKPMFYLLLPVRQITFIPLILGLQVIPISGITLIASLLIIPFVPEKNLLAFARNGMHVMFFFIMVKMAIIPVLVYAKRHFVYVFFYFLSFIPIWVITGLIEETFFMHLDLRYLYNAMIFFTLSYGLNWHIISRLRK